MIIARKDLKTLNEMQFAFNEPVFIPEVYEKISAQYDKFRLQSAEKMDKVPQAHSEELSGYFTELAEKSIAASGVRAVGSSATGVLRVNRVVMISSDNSAKVSTSTLTNSYIYD